jgi:hypothetical protein
MPARDSLRVTDQPTKRDQGFWLDLTANTALADHSHQKLTKAIVQFLDVREHAHGLLVLCATPPLTV